MKTKSFITAEEEIQTLDEKIENYNKEILDLQTQITDIKKESKKKGVLARFSIRNNNDALLKLEKQSKSLIKEKKTSIKDRETLIKNLNIPSNIISIISNSLDILNAQEKGNALTIALTILKALGSVQNGLNTYNIINVKLKKEGIQLNLESIINLESINEILQSKFVEELLSSPKFWEGLNRLSPKIIKLINLSHNLIDDAIKKEIDKLGDNKANFFLDQDNNVICTINGKSFLYPETEALHQKIINALISRQTESFQLTAEDIAILSKSELIKSHIIEKKPDLLTKETDIHLAKIILGNQEALNFMGNIISSDEMIGALINFIQSSKILNNNMNPQEINKEQFLIMTSSLADFLNTLAKYNKEISQLIEPNNLNNTDKVSYIKKILEDPSLVGYLCNIVSNSKSAILSGLKVEDIRNTLDQILKKYNLKTIDIDELVQESALIEIVEKIISNIPKIITQHESTIVNLLPKLNRNISTTEDKSQEKTEFKNFELKNLITLTKDIVITMKDPIALLLNDPYIKLTSFKLLKTQLKENANFFKYANKYQIELNDAINFAILVSSNMVDFISKKSNILEEIPNMLDLVPVFLSNDSTNVDKIEATRKLIKILSNIELDSLLENNKKIFLEFQNKITYDQEIFNRILKDFIPLIYNLSTILIQKDSLIAIDELIEKALPLLDEELTDQDKVIKLFELSDKIIDFLNKDSFITFYKDQFVTFVKDHKADLLILGKDYLQNNILGKKLNIDPEKLIDIISDQESIKILHDSYKLYKENHSFKAIWSLVVGSPKIKKLIFEVAYEFVTSIFFQEKIVPNFYRRYSIGNVIRDAVEKAHNNESEILDLSKVLIDTQKGHLSNSITKYSINNLFCAGLNFKDLDFSNFIIDNFNFSNCNFEKEASFKNTKIKNTDFSNAKFGQKINFENTEMDIESFKSLLRSIDNIKNIDINLENITITNKLSIKDEKELSNLTFGKPYLSLRQDGISNTITSRKISVPAVPIFNSNTNRNDTRGIV